MPKRPRRILEEDENEDEDDLTITELSQRASRFQACVTDETAFLSVAPASTQVDGGTPGRKQPSPSPPSSPSPPPSPREGRPPKMNQSTLDNCRSVVALDVIPGVPQTLYLGEEDVSHLRGLLETATRDGDAGRILVVLRRLSVMPCTVLVWALTPSDVPLPSSK